EDGDDATNGVGDAARDRQPLDDRIEERERGGNAIALAFAGLLHGLEQQQRPEDDVVERSASGDRAAVDLSKKTEDARPRAVSLVVVEEARELGQKDAEHP